MTDNNTKRVEITTNSDGKMLIGASSNAIDRIAIDGTTISIECGGVTIVINQEEEPQTQFQAPADNNGDINGNVQKKPADNNGDINGNVQKKPADNNGDDNEIAEVDTSTKAVARRFDDAVAYLLRCSGHQFLELVAYARANHNSFPDDIEELSGSVNADDAYCSALINITRPFGEEYESGIMGIVLEDDVPFDIRVMLFEAAVARYNNNGLTDEYRRKAEEYIAKLPSTEVIELLDNLDKFRYIPELALIKNKERFIRNTILNLLVTIGVSAEPRKIVCDTLASDTCVSERAAILEMMRRMVASKKNEMD